MKPPEDVRRDPAWKWIGKAEPDPQTAEKVWISNPGFPVFRCTGPVSTEDVKALDDEE